MSSEICGIRLPKALEEYEILNGDAKISPVAPCNENINSDVRVNRDSRGRILSIGYYSACGELEKLVFYSGMSITRINYYKGDRLCKVENFENEKVVNKIVYKRDGQIAFEIDYKFADENLIEINKNVNGSRFIIGYKYDDLDRIVKRSVFVNGEKRTVQEYSYDVLNRIKSYKDENQEIVVQNISTKNELISYVITDRIGNDINIENHFTECGYVSTDMVLNGHGITVSDTSYVDNVMLKKPNATDEDLDLIIANLFKAEPKAETNTFSDSVEKKSMGLIDQNIQTRTLPISIRKRLLLNFMSAR